MELRYPLVKSICILLLLINGAMAKSDRNRKKSYLKFDHIEYSTDTNSYCHHYDLQNRFDYGIIYPCNNEEAINVFEYVQNAITNPMDANIYIDNNNHVAIKLDGSNCHNDLAICVSTNVSSTLEGEYCVGKKISGKGKQRRNQRKTNRKCGQSLKVPEICVVRSFVNLYIIIVIHCLFEITPYHRYNSTNYDCSTKH